MALRTLFIFLVFLFGSLGLKASFIDPSDSIDEKIVTLHEIHVVGNKRTKEFVVLREISASQGEKYRLDELKKVIEASKIRIYNTNLFNSVESQILELNETEVDLVITLDERWYFYPSPIFRIADRNLMDWLRNRGGGLNRFNYGLKLDHFNFRGRNEKVRFIGEIGFERRFILSYIVPYIEDTRKHGLIFDFAYLENEDLAYITENHLPSFIESESINRTTFNTSITHTFRPSYYSTHYSTIGFKTTNVSDTIVALNPNFLGNSRTDQKHFRLRYRFINDLRNNRNYSTAGHYLFLEVYKKGLGIFKDLDKFSISGIYSKYNDLGKGFYLANSVIGFISFPKQQPYFDYSGLGFDELFARGFELSVIEGHRYVMTRNSFRKLLFDLRGDMGDVISIDQFDDAKLQLYLKLFFDTGWVDNYPQYESNTRLTNTFLYSLGAGIDVVTMYDLVLRFEYSLNSEQQWNFALNIKADI